LSKPVTPEVVARRGRDPIEIGGAEHKTGKDIVNVSLPARADSKVVSNQDPSSSSNERRNRHTDQHSRRTSDRAVAIFLAFLAVILMLGYLLMTKLADDSRAENCMMAHRKNCGAIEWPSN
jgi:hypothetical protein